ncbi:alphaK I11 [Puccinia graminis f. sp. tritici CRL 75-36-700-3]|uniref:AlphaK I11 n=1 Tax=Puccinia graminis f. sp. tritici (strain CRL 75-36-700-3 / race SCCL) TaxID=418459 RepID=E3KEV2_PUCGT|nr:alphaK I11 [Puccinia graminis f. sp. tritici CRL 75-36-700-3]EFP83008.2 alphaK I11 [Puccinia graminis f. sp. tritici CRL 75-36-700-3]
MPSCGKCSRTTDSIVLGWCNFCLKDAGIKEHHIEASLHKPLASTSSNPPATTSSQFPFRRNTVIRPSSQPSSVPPTSTSALDEYFQNAVRNKRKKPQVAPYSKNKPPRSSSKSTSDKDNERLIDCGFVLYVDNKINTQTGILNVKQKVDLDNPKLYEDLLDSLWQLFDKQLQKKSLLPHSPDSAEGCVSLAQGKSVLPTPEALEYVVRKSNDRKPVLINIIYQYETPQDKSSDSEYSSSNNNNSSSKPTTRSSRSRSTTNTKISKSRSKDYDSSDDSNSSLEENLLITKSSTRSSRKKSLVDDSTRHSRKQSTRTCREKSVVNQSRSSDDNNMSSSDDNITIMPPPTQPSVKNPLQHHHPKNKTSRSTISGVSPMKKNRNSWASAGIASTMPRLGSSSLSTQLRILGQNNNDIVDVVKTGWIHANRFIFKTFERTEYELLKAETEPITLRIFRDVIIGQGSMRRALKAEVKSISEDGAEIISNYVAKIRYKENLSSLSAHANDAMMYEASGLLLRKFKSIIAESNRVEQQFKQRAKKMEIVRHAVVATGDTQFPSEVFFLEAALEGTYVKYSSNIDFDVAEDQPGMEPRICRLMNAFTHWSYVESKGNSLICDLQGVGPILTDPQIIDLDHTRWADGNNAKEGISMFIKNHICNEICIQLRLESPDTINKDNPSNISTSNQLQRLTGRITTPKRPPAHQIQIQSSLPIKSSLSHIINYADGALPSGWLSDHPATTTD